MIPPGAGTFQQCVKCGWIRRDGPYLPYHYDLGYFQGWLGSPGARAFNAGMAGRFLPPEPGRLLEVGAGMGFFLEAAAELGWEVYGNDISPEACNISLAKGVTNIRSGNFETLGRSYKQGFFQAVAMIHVIEHLKEPVETARECRRLLSDGGWLYLHTPDAAYFHDITWPHHVEEHRSFFTRKTMEVLAGNLGMDIVALEGFPELRELAVVFCNTGGNGR